MDARITVNLGKFQVVYEGKNYSWLQVFEAAEDIDTNIDHIKGEIEKLKAKANSMAKVFLSIAKKAATVEEFNMAFDAMKLQYKSIKKNANIPQSISDAASVIRRYWKAGGDIAGSTSVEVMRRKLIEARKEAKAKVAPEGITALLEQVRETYRLLEDEGAQKEFMARVMGLCDEYRGAIVQTAERVEEEAEDAVIVGEVHDERPALDHQQAV